MTEPTRATIRQRLFAFLVAGLGGLVASVISFSMALYEAAHPPDVPIVPVGQRIDTGRWFVTLRSAHVGTVPPTGIAPSRPQQLVMVNLDVVNRSATPNNVLVRVLKLSAPAAELPMPTAYLDRDKSLAGYFNPDMPERVTMAWEWPPNVPVPDRLTLTVSGQVYKRRDNLYGASGWYDRDPVATVELPMDKSP
jgi:hypothetical protein